MIEVFLFKVIAIFASEVASSSNRLQHDIKRLSKGSNGIWHVHEWFIVSEVQKYRSSEVQKFRSAEVRNLRSPEAHYTL